MIPILPFKLASNYYLSSKLCQSLYRIEWDDILKSLDINDARQVFHTRFDKIIQDCIPMDIPRAKKKHNIL